MFNKYLIILAVEIIACIAGLGQENEANTNQWSYKKQTIYDRSRHLLYSLLNIERGIALVDRAFRRQEQLHFTNDIYVLGIGMEVRTKADLRKLQMKRDCVAIKILEFWRANPSVIDDKDLMIYNKHTGRELFQQLTAEEEEIRRRLNNPEKYQIFNYVPYLTSLSTMIFRNAKECEHYVMSTNKTERIWMVMIIAELMDENSLPILAKMAKDDPIVEVRKDAADAWMHIKMPYRLNNDEKKQWLKDLINQQGVDSNNLWQVEAAQRSMAFKNEFYPWNRFGFDAPLQSRKEVQGDSVKIEIRKQE